MFVRSSTYMKLRADFSALQLKHAQLQLEDSVRKREWNRLIDRINAKGGQEFLDLGIVPTRLLGGAMLSKDDVKRMLMLCHPDKHGGKEAAKEITQKLLKLREIL